MISTYDGKRLKDLRKERHMTQLQVQIETGIDQSDYSKLETGKRHPTFYQLIELSRLYGTSIDYLCGVTDEKTPYPRNLQG